MFKKAQQEIVGFVLIVVIVVIALLVFMVIKAGSPTKVYESVTTDNIITGIMLVTTQCKTNLNTDYRTIGDLLEDCYNNKRCQNIEKNSCDVLNQTLKEILDNVLDIEAMINAYEINYTFFSEEGSEEKIFFSNGVCLGTIYGSNPQLRILNKDEGVAIDLKICSE